MVTALACVRALREEGKEGRAGLWEAELKLRAFQKLRSLRS